MSAMSFIFEPHRGQSMGSPLYTFAISLAQAGSGRFLRNGCRPRERQAACNIVVGFVASVGGDIGSAWDFRHP